uniref:NADH-ubiquinone oxidoreductase chain 6 n=1 Tax=Odontolabis cuvera fallaciosa TaxID=619051 RepID=A0A3G1TVQ1_9SCAR|nr:NADH dehydrogenase subunit 6 [Odontolabis cuvera fallaciosa]
MMTMMTLMMIPTSLIMFMNHPLSAGLILLSQTIMIGMSTSMLMYSSWYSYILILIMIGGMLVLFMYMTSVASNEKFKFSMSISATMSSILMLNIMMFILDKWSYSSWLMNPESFSVTQTFSTSLNKYLNFPTISISMTLIMYLLVTLIAIIKIIDIKHGPLRHLN